ncbi:MAG: response regulator [Spirochaetes bacterium]|nr:response regulator [Spirochaetota bacterium]
MSKILVVDDDDTSLAIIESVLSGSGFEVDTFDSASRALQELRHENYDLILSDYFMPGMNGDEFLKSVRGIDRDTPFVFLTANTDIKLAIELVKSGADDHIVKPIIAEELLFRVNKTLQERENRRIIRQVERERELLELEHRKLVNWRALYASKDITQTEQMINLLSRTINQAGGFLWVDLVKAQMEEKETGEGCVIEDDLVEMIVTAGESQKAIFDYITFIGELDTIELSTEVVRIPDLFNELESYARELLGRIRDHHSRELHIMRPSQPIEGTVHVDRNYFRKLVHELLVNAVKYSPQDSRVLVSLDRNADLQGNYLDICVRNTAKLAQAKDREGNPIIGIPYDYSELVFDLFYTIESFPVHFDEEEWSDGTGLYVARKLLKRQNGWIKASNGVDYTGNRRACCGDDTLRGGVRQWQRLY